MTSDKTAEEIAKEAVKGDRQAVERDYGLIERDERNGK